MVRVHVICEGQTEEMFVKELLQPEFFPKGIYLNPMLVGKPGHKGGNFKFERLFTDVRNHLFSDPAAFAESIGKSELKQSLLDISAEFATPEHINDRPQTAPSKRIEQLISGYEKPTMGNLAAINIGLASMRQQCKIFSQWLGRLEELID